MAFNIQAKANQRHDWGYVCAGPAGWSISPLRSDRMRIVDEVTALSVAAWLQNEFGWKCEAMPADQGLQT